MPTAAAAAAAASLTLLLTMLEWTTSRSLGGAMNETEQLRDHALSTLADTPNLIPVQLACPAARAHSCHHKHQSRHSAAAIGRSAARSFHQMRPLLSPASLNVRSSFCHDSAPSARSIGEAPPRASLAVKSLQTAFGLAPRQPERQSGSQKRSEKLTPLLAKRSDSCARGGPGGSGGTGETGGAGSGDDGWLKVRVALCERNGRR